MPGSASHPLRLKVLGTTELGGAEGGEARAILAQPKRFALLVWLALAGRGRFVRRDTVIALLWPEASSDAARHALRQGLHFLRQSLGPTVVTRRGEDEFGVDAEVLWCDAVEFERALDEGRLIDALSLYAGDLLPGFFATDVSPEFQQWLDGERERLRRRVADAAWRAAQDAEARGSREEAAHYARLGARFDPDDEAAFRRLLQLLDRLGDRTGALRAYDDFRRRLAEEFEVEPGPETQAIVSAIRARPMAPAASLATSAAPGTRPVGEAVVSAAPVPLAGTPSRRTRHVAWTVGILAVGLAAAAVLAWRLRAPRGPVVLAVGAIDDRGGSNAAGSDPALRGLLATDLARIPGLEVVSQARLYEILGQLGLSEESPATLSDVARRAGATELLEGALVHLGPDSLRLDLRRVDLRRGVVRGGLSVEGTNLVHMIRQASVEIAGQLGLSAPFSPPEGSGPGALAAQRLYEEGLRAYYRGNSDAAAQLFEAALAEDSTLAMAAYYGGVVADQRRDVPSMFRLSAHALRMADRAPERDRLLVRVGWMQLTNDPRGLVLAESLAVRYPNDPAALYAWASALSWGGAGLAAIPHLRRVVVLESLSLREGSPLCRACDALGNITWNYVGIDSLAAAERTLRELLRHQPRSAGAWSSLAHVFEMAGREREALEAAAETDRAVPGSYDQTLLRARLALRMGRFEEADRILEERARDPSGALEALWWSVISLRNQGRLLEALTVAGRHRTLMGREHTLQKESAAPVAQVLFELGRYRAAEALFDSIAHAEASQEPSAPGLIARGVVWPLTHAGTALAAAGDTAALARRASRVEELGRESALGRDRHLHHYLRGLLAQARGQPDEAVRQFSAVGSFPTGFSRAHLEWGRLLTRLNRPAEAIAVLRPVLHGSMEASGYYATFRELHEALADAFAAAGMADSAAAHRAWVERARGADRSS